MDLATLHTASTLPHLQCAATATAAVQSLAPGPACTRSTPSSETAAVPVCREAAQAETSSETQHALQRAAVRQQGIVIIVPIRRQANPSLLL